MSQLRYILPSTSFRQEESSESMDELRADLFQTTSDMVSFRAINRIIEQNDSSYTSFDEEDSYEMKKACRKRKRADADTQSINIAPKKKPYRKHKGDTNSKNYRKKARPDERAPPGMSENLSANSIVTQHLLAPVVDVKRVVAAQIAQMLAGATAAQKQPEPQAAPAILKPGSNINSFKIEVNTSPLITFRFVPRHTMANMTRSKRSAEAPWRQPDNELGSYEEFCGVTIRGSPARGKPISPQQNLEPDSPVQCAHPEHLENTDLLSDNFNVDFAGLNSEILPNSTGIFGRTNDPRPSPTKSGLNIRVFPNDRIHAACAQHSPQRRQSSLPVASPNAGTRTGSPARYGHQHQGKVPAKWLTNAQNENIRPPTNGSNVFTYADIRRLQELPFDMKERQNELFQTEMKLLVGDKVKWQWQEQEWPLDDSLTELHNLGPSWTDFSAYGVFGPPTQYGYGDGWDDMLQVIVNAKSPRVWPSDPL